MPNLPTFTVTDATATRLLKAFEGQTDPEGNPLTAQQAYKVWLKSNLMSYVTSQEAKAGSATLSAELT